MDSFVAIYLTSIGFGLAVAAPVGPMAVLCMRRTLVQGWRYGLAIGLGIAVGDGIYACVAALGLAGVSAFMLAYERPLHAAAGLFLLYLGIKTMFARDNETSERKLAQSTGMAFGSAVLLTLTNPPTIILFAAIFAALAPKGGFDMWAALATVGGVFTGSLLWWCGVTALVASVRHALGAPVRRWINRVAGAVLACFGVVEVRRAM
jgi:threonine/homoserine/homoserine lactone efflux protein